MNKCTLIKDEPREHKTLLHHLLMQDFAEVYTVGQMSESHQSLSTLFGSGITYSFSFVFTMTALRFNESGCMAYTFLLSDTSYMKFDAILSVWSRHSFPPDFKSSFPKMQCIGPETTKHIILKIVPSCNSATELFLFFRRLLLSE